MAIELLELKAAQNTIGVLIWWVHSEAQLANTLTKSGRHKEVSCSTGWARPGRSSPIQERDLRVSDALTESSHSNRWLMAPSWGWFPGLGSWLHKDTGVVRAFAIRRSCLSDISQSSDMVQYCIGFYALDEKVGDHVSLICWTSPRLPVPMLATDPYGSLQKLAVLSWGPYMRDPIILDP